MENSSIYLDTNIYRRITRILSHWQELEKFLDKEEPGLLDNCTLLFSWSQVLEESDLGSILTEVEKTAVWKQEIERKKLIDRFGFQEGLNKYFATTLKALESLPALQKNSLLDAIDGAVSYTCKEAQRLVQNTMLRYRDFVGSGNYKEQLTKELAWAFICSYPFIQSKRQWEKRKLVYYSLMALWHELFLKGHELPFFRLSERQYLSYLLYDPEVDITGEKSHDPNVLTRKDLVDKIFKFPPLKPKGDLCDGEIIHYSYLGDNRVPIIGITMDSFSKINQRAGIFERSLIDLKDRVAGWNIKVRPGKIYSLDVANDGIINPSYRLLPSTFISEGLQNALGPANTKEEIAETKKTV